MSPKAEKPSATPAPSPERKNVPASAPAAAAKLPDGYNRLTSEVERVALVKSGYNLIYKPEEKIPSLIVENFPALGRLAACRFLEWAGQNPEGVISLPTGKTPEHFIKFVQSSLKNWDKKETRAKLEAMGLATDRKPDLSGLRFVQIDEFYPINTAQHNSFYYYVNKYYLKGFGLDPARAMLIDPVTIGVPAGKTLEQLCPDMKIDLSLRFRRPKTLLEKQQQELIWEVDQFCCDYEKRIQDMGGIGFFLGGIGPDGHIAFNCLGSDLYSTTRLTEANYETKAAAASDLGGIEVSRDKYVITIGLGTITYKKDAVAIIIAAGEAKAKIISRTIESEPHCHYPGSVLSKLENGRFYLTKGAACQLKNRLFVDFKNKPEAAPEDIHRIVMDLSLQNDKPIKKLQKDDFEKDRFGKELLAKTKVAPAVLIKQTEEQIAANLKRGMTTPDGKTYIHTAPHHDDLILAYMPYITHLARKPTNKHYFVYLTSGFTAVTNGYMLQVCEDLIRRLKSGKFDELFKSGYFDPSNQIGYRLDAAHFLRGASRKHEEVMNDATARRLVRNMIDLYEDDNRDNLVDRLGELLNYFRTQYPGKKDIPLVQSLKGRMREFESDLKWASYGFHGEAVRHLRLGFYKGDTFNESPTLERDALPVLKLLKETNPDYVTVAFDPEGSGPDTHYKVLQAIAQALKEYERQTGRHDLKVIGYRNVWFKYHPSEVNYYVPVAIRHLDAMEATFLTCFATQKNASFPSYEVDGPFSHLARKVQVKQYNQMVTLLGEDFFVQHEDHTLRGACAMVYLKEMTLEEFFTKSEALKKGTEE